MRGAALAAALLALAAVAVAQPPPANAKPEATATIRPALTVALTRPQSAEMPLRLSAYGSIAAWQEAILGAEVNGLRLVELRADVGDAVKSGAVLAVFSSETIEADVAQSRAALAEAEASLGEARANAERARAVQSSGALSAQQIAQYLSGEKIAEARTASLRAALDQQLLRLKHTRVLASDDGIISSRSATLGAVVPLGQELFRLIRKARLEWRAEVTAADLALLKPGQAVTVRTANTAGGEVRNTQGRVRLLGPTVDPQTRNALVYVDLPGATLAGLRPGMYAGGEFLIGRKSALMVPQQALVLRDGFSYVFTLGAQNRVSQVKVQLGRREGERYEVLSGLKPGEAIVAGGASFLTDGDTVRVSNAVPAAPAAR